MRPHVEPAPAHHLFPRFLRHVYCTSLNSSSSPLSDSLCLSDSVLVCFHPGFSRQDSLTSPSDSLSEFILTWFCLFSTRSKQRASRTTSHVSVSFDIRKQNVESSTLNLQRFLDQHPLQWKIRSFFISNEPLRQFRFHDRCMQSTMPRVAKQIFLDHRFPGITQDLPCPTFASHNSSLDDVGNLSYSITMTHEDSLNYAFRQ